MIPSKAHPHSPEDLSLGPATLFVSLRQCLCSPGWPQMPDLPASTSQVLRLQACTTIHAWFSLLRVQPPPNIITLVPQILNPWVWGTFKIQATVPSENKRPQPNCSPNNKCVCRQTLGHQRAVVGHTGKMLSKLTAQRIMSIEVGLF